MNITDFITRLLAHLGVEDSQVEILEEEKYIQVQIKVAEEDSGLLIGYHGETLAALQRLTQLSQRESTDKKIVINVNDYKQHREEQLKEMTERIAQRVLETRQSYLFPFLPANERLIVHSALAEMPEFAELESVSTGEGSNRRLEIRFKEVAGLSGSQNSRVSDEEATEAIAEVEESAAEPAEDNNNQE